MSDTQDPSDSELVIIHTATSLQGAQLLAGLLESEGVRATVPGAELNDEFGMAAKMVGAADVVVRRGDLDRAKDIVAAWEQRGDADG